MFLVCAVNLFRFLFSHFPASGPPSLLFILAGREIDTIGGAAGAEAGAVPLGGAGTPAAEGALAPQDGDAARGPRRGRGAGPAVAGGGGTRGQGLKS